MSRNTSCFSFRVPLISSHPAAEHPSPSTVTMSNTEARHSGRHEWSFTFTQSRSVSLSSPQKNLSRISPVRVCLITEGWRAQGSRYRAISIHSASLPSAQAPQLTGDHNIYHARKLKLKGTMRFISSMSRVISGKDLKIYPPAYYVAHLFTDRWRTWNVTVVIKRKMCFTCEGAWTWRLILFTLNSISRGDIHLLNYLNTTV